MMIEIMCYTKLKKYERNGRNETLERRRIKVKRKGTKQKKKERKGGMNELIEEGQISLFLAASCLYTIGKRRRKKFYMLRYILYV